MKKLLALLITLLAISPTTALAEERNISIDVDNRSVVYTDVTPVIKDDRVLVPLRDVFNAMGAEVKWNGEERTVTVESKDHTTRLIFTIDDVNFKRIDFLTVLKSEIKDLTTDVPPVIVNDRTMIPLRVVSENFAADVIWDDATSKVTIYTKQLKKASGVETYEEEAYLEYAQTIPQMSLVADKETVKEGEEVTLTVDLAKLDAYKEYDFASESVCIEYDSEKFEYKGFEIAGLEEGQKIENVAENAQYNENMVKLVFVVDPEIKIPVKDMSIVKVKFVAKTKGDAQFTLADGVSALGYENFVMMNLQERIEYIGAAETMYLNNAPVNVTVE